MTSSINNSSTSHSGYLWANLLHLSYNFWNAKEDPTPWHGRAREGLQFDDQVWTTLTRRMAEAGFNMLVLDLGDAVKYTSHPEIAVKGAWEPTRLVEEQARLRELGIELIPKLNFSTAHDAWLGPYSHCVSTPDYYKVCEDLICEVMELMGRPRFFHLGMDEEQVEFQTSYTRPTSRKGPLFWHDYLAFFKVVESYGARPWVWSDYIWKHREEFVQQMPKNVLQSNWYYGIEFGNSEENGKKFSHNPQVQAYLDLDHNGYEQMPTPSNWWHRFNPELTLRYARENLTPHLLKGFLLASWYPTTPDYLEHNLEAIEYIENARTKWQLH